MNQIYVYCIGNNEEYPEDYSEYLIYTTESIPEWEWKKLVADAEKACFRENEEEGIMYYHCSPSDIYHYILNNDKRFFVPIAKGCIQVKSFGKCKEKVGIQHYHYNE